MKCKRNSGYYKDHKKEQQESVTTSNFISKILPIVNALWCFILTIVVIIYLSSEKAIPSIDPQESTTTTTTTTSSETIKIPFTFIEDKNQLLSTRVDWNTNLGLSDILHYHVCCIIKKRMVCRLGSNRSLGIDATLGLEKLEAGSSINHSRKHKLFFNVVAEHPNMTGAVCWIICKIKK